MPGSWAPRPTLRELLTRVAGDIAARTEGRPYIRRTVERVLGFVVAGVAHHLHAHLGWVREQQYPQSAEAEGVADWADLVDEPRKQGAYAAGRATFAGAPVPAGTLAQSRAGVLYRLGVALSGSEYEVEATETGANTNLAVGEALQLVSPVEGVEPNGVVTAALSGGADVEELELWRDRVIVALRSPRPYGAPGDYRRWALSREGVTEAWEFDRRMGPGTVTVAFVFGERDDVIPTPSDVAEMQTYLDSVRPADMLAAYAVAPIRNGLTLGITARGTMTSADVIAAVQRVLTTDAAVEEPLARSVLDEAISGVAGELSHTITDVAVTERGVTRILSPDVAEIAPGPLGLLTLSNLVLTVVP